MESSDPKPQLSVGAAIQRYWPCIVGVALFPSISLLGQRLHIPFGVFAGLFIALFAFTSWPVITRRAPYSFWLLAMAAWGIGIAFVVGISKILGPVR